MINDSTSEGGSHKYKAMELPREVVLGHNAILDVGEVLKRVGIEGSVLMVCDEVTREIAGKKAQEILSNGGYEVSSFIIKGATKEQVDRVAAQAKEVGAKCAIGVGGGRPLDVAKLAGPQVGIPFISVPTAASHDGIASSRASIEDQERKRSIQARTPLAVVGDTKIIASSPFRLMAAGCGDIISNSTSVKDWLLAKKLKGEPYSNSAATLAEITANMIIERSATIKPGLEDSAWTVLHALVSSGVAMSIAGSSRPASGAEHMFSHALDKLAPKPALHGEQCAVGTIMMMYLHGGDWKSIRRAMKIIGLPTDAKGLNIPEEVIIEALLMAPKIRPARYTILGDGLTREAAHELAQETMVIES